MKKLYIVAALLIAGMQFCLAQGPFVPQKGSKALNSFMCFSRNSLFNVRTGVQADYFIQDGLALTANVRLGYRTDNILKENGDKDSQTVDNETLISAGLKKYLVGYKHLNGYVGLDAMIGGAHEKYTRFTSDYATAQDILEFGARPYMGVEAFFLNNFFIGLECGYDVLFSSGKQGAAAGGDLNPDMKKLAGHSIIDVADLSYAAVRFGFVF